MPLTYTKEDIQTAYLGLPLGALEKVQQEALKNQQRARQELVALEREIAQRDLRIEAVAELIEKRKAEAG